MTAPITLAEIREHLEQQAPCAHRTAFDFGGCRIGVAASSPDLVTWLERYYRDFAPPDPDLELDFEVRAHQVPQDLDLDIEFGEWTREPGKTLGKEAFYDLPDGSGRVVLKVRTGMRFLVGPGHRVAFGDCAANANQVVNFINFQLTSWYMNRDHALCHAAGIVQNGRGLGMASYSGGGKSTLALHLISRGADFCSNDRVLAHHGDDGNWMVGVPKHPRINPGTILGNPDLAGILPPERRRELEAMPIEELWTLEEKYDAVIGDLFGPGRIALRAPLDGFLILDWKPGGSEPCRVEPVRIDDEPQLLDAVVKSPGPFYWPEDAPPPTGYEPPQRAPYLAALSTVPFYVARGGSDFETAAAFCRERLGVA